MKVDLIDYTDDGIHKIAELARATKKTGLDYKPTTSATYPKTFEKDEKFVKGLLKVKHLGILEHISFTFHISEVSRVLTHQLVRHRLASYLQMSGRHAKPDLHNYITPETCREDGSINAEYQNGLFHAYNSYSNLIKAGVPIEDARYVLPPAFFTHLSMTMNVRNIRHFLELRLDKAAQWEIRELAGEIFKIVYNKYPVLFEDLKDKFDKNDVVRLAVEHSKTMNALAEK